MTPLNFDNLLQRARNLGGHDGNKSFKSPSTSIKCGYALKTTCLILRGKALREWQQERKLELDNFMELYETEWGSRISAPALGNLDSKKRNRADVLPITNDLLKLRNYSLELSN